VYEDTWAIGKPDLILSMEKEVEIPADGVLDWQYFRLPSNLTTDRWITAMEVRAGEAKAGRRPSPVTSRRFTSNGCCSS
jgi:hypothetical protein